MEKGTKIKINGSSSYDISQKAWYIVFFDVYPDNCACAGCNFGV